MFCYAPRISFLKPKRREQACRASLLNADARLKTSLLGELAHSLSETTGLVAPQLATPLSLKKGSAGRGVAKQPSPALNTSGSTMVHTARSKKKGGFGKGEGARVECCAVPQVLCVTVHVTVHPLPPGVPIFLLLVSRFGLPPLVVLVPVRNSFGALLQNTFPKVSSGVQNPIVVSNAAHGPADIDLQRLAQTSTRKVLQTSTWAERA
jgi:hypothetical protein